jgi:hypothetical protein
MAVFARSAGIASYAGRCFRQARKGEGGYYGDDERYRFHGFSIVFQIAAVLLGLSEGFGVSLQLVGRDFHLERVQRRSQRAWPSRLHFLEQKWVGVSRS